MLWILGLLLVQFLVQFGFLLQKNQNPEGTFHSHHQSSPCLKLNIMVWREGRSASLSAQYVKKGLGHGNNRQSTGSISMLIRMSINVRNVVKSLVRLVIIKKHVLLHQEEKKKIACEDCGQRFSYPSQLKSHLDVHSKSKIFKCPSRGCGKVFKHSITLKWHQENTIRTNTNVPIVHILLIYNTIWKII